MDNRFYRKKMLAGLILSQCIPLKHFSSKHMAVAANIQFL